MTTQIQSDHYIGARTKGRDNHFNLIRMIAASGVLVAHAFPISLGEGATEPLQLWLNGTSLGTVCVYIFFVISGFFITKSFDRSPNLHRFIYARVLRVYPALLVVLLVTVFGGALLTTAPSGPYWQDSFFYVLRNLSLFDLQYDLTGVFDANPFGPAINGSLWTLVHEVACYVGVFLLGVIGLLRHRVAMVVLLLAITFLQFLAPLLPVPDRVLSFLKLALPFAVGTAFYIWRDNIPLHKSIGFALVLTVVLAFPTPIFNITFVVCLSYWVFLLGLSHSPALLNYNRLGDYSYGVYIYAFPIQQCVAFGGITNPILNMMIALPLTLGCAVLSWHLIEKPALSLVKRNFHAQKAL